MSYSTLSSKSGIPPEVKYIGDKRSFFRKGVQGDWKNDLDEKAEKLVKNEAIDMLDKLGYEIYF